MYKSVSRKRLIPCNHLILSVSLLPLSLLLIISSDDLAPMILSIEPHETHTGIYLYRKRLDTLFHHPNFTSISLLQVCQLHGDEGSRFLFPWWSVHLGMPRGSVVEISMSIGGSRAPFVEGAIIFQLNFLRIFMNNKLAVILEVCFGTHNSFQLNNVCPFGSVAVLIIVNLCYVSKLARPLTILTQRVIPAIIHSFLLSWTVLLRFSWRL